MGGAEVFEGALWKTGKVVEVFGGGAGFGRNGTVLECGGCGRGGEG